MKPDDISQDVWDAADALAENIGTYEDGSVCAHSITAIARAIQSAKAEAYEKAAGVAEKYRGRFDGFKVQEPDKTVFGWGTARREIATAIRALSK